MAASGPTKGAHYKRLYDRLSTARQRQFHLEASWIAYSLIEDRTNSALRLAGKTPGRMLGGKLKKLEKLIASDSEYAKAFFDSSFLPALRSWAGQRNNLMHDLGNMVKNESELQVEAAAVAKEGQQLAKQFSSSVMRLKKLLRKR